MKALDGSSISESLSRNSSPNETASEVARLEGEAVVRLKFSLSLNGAFAFLAGIKYRFKRRKANRALPPTAK